MPADILAILSNIREEVRELRQLAAAESVNRKFTLDGRFVGDVGEWLVARHFPVTLDEGQRTGHDAIVTINGRQRNVQIKCRCECDVIDFKRVPDLLLVIEVKRDWSAWSVAYNGPGELAVDLTVKKSVRRTLDQLRASQSSVLSTQQVSLVDIET